MDISGDNPSTIPEKDLHFTSGFVIPVYIYIYTCMGCLGPRHFEKPHICNTVLQNYRKQRFDLLRPAQNPKPKTLFDINLKP